MWAFIENSVVRDVTDIDPTGRFHPSLSWVVCPDDVQVGYLYDGKQFSTPLGPSADDLAVSARADRDALLKSSDWVALRALESGQSVPAEWLAYRQNLRDVPAQKGFPKSIEWPKAPTL